MVESSAKKVWAEELKVHTAENKLVYCVAKTYEKITNQRDYFLHKVANKYVANYGVIYIEDLNIKDMDKNHALAKYIRDASWGSSLNYWTTKRKRLVD